MTGKAQWMSETKRRDGLAIFQMGNGNWVVNPRRGAPLSRCPCCDRPLSFKQARLLADFVYPMEKASA